MIGTSRSQSPLEIVENVIALARFYFVELGNVTGGSLHIVLSDGNIKPGHIKYCLGYAELSNDHVGAALAKCLLELTDKQVQEVYEACGQF